MRSPRSIGQSSARWQVLGARPRAADRRGHRPGHRERTPERPADRRRAGRGGPGRGDRDNPDDRRARLLELTPAGAEAMKAIYARQVEWSQQIMAGLDPAQLARIADELEAISALIEGEDQ